MTCSRKVRRARALALLVACLGAVASPAGVESSISAVVTTSTWAAIACREQVLSRVCEIDKDYEDPGLLQPIVSVGDVVYYRNRRGQGVHVAPCMRRVARGLVTQRPFTVLDPAGCREPASPPADKRSG